MEKIKIDKKNIICIAIIIFVFMLGMIIGYTIKPNNNKTCETKEERKEEIKENIGRIGDFEFKTIETKFEAGTSKFEVEITNKGTEPKYLKEFKMKIKKENNEEIILSGAVNEEISDNKLITISYGDDLSNYQSIEYEIGE